MNFRIWLDLFWAFLKVGTFTFGGGYAMLPLIHKEVVEHKKWVAEAEIVDILAIAQSAPGVIAVNSAVFVGKRVGGIVGALAAAAGVILPAFLAIILILIFLGGVQTHPVTEKVMAGIRAASAALILLAALSIGQSVLKQRSSYLVATVVFLAIIIFDINAAWAIVFGGIIGYLGYRWRKEEQ
ncbi:MAG TPA: chromate transporter [Bacillota bacterium]|nr:chromate transporter [Bacillota bacterium]